MTRKIFRSILAVASLVLAASLAIMLGVMYEYFVARQRTQLASLGALAAQGVSEEGIAYFERLDTRGVRLTWIAADGTVLYDNEADPAGMGNHADREEIREALASGVGESERMSETLAEKTLYRAQRLPDGTVLRSALTQYSLLSLALEMLWPLLAIVVLSLALSALLARRLSLRIVRPLNALDLESPLENDAYEELSPLLTRIERQRRQIKSQLDELRWKKDEFAAITQHMNEGLILINEDNVVLSMNPAAARLFQAGEECLGKDMLAIDRSLAVQELINEARRNGHAERVVAIDKEEYQLNASTVVSGGRAAGVALLAFNITEKARAEQMRREFSANVSHELKTPLHAIMGSAELIENGMAKSEDIPRFAKRIRVEAGRLVALIDDIIRLSQLDEGAAFPREEVDLKALAGEAIQALEEAAANRGVQVSLSGENARITGARRLLYEIVYNLIDNAVKYNVQGGRVE
ncbi:MAG TPA: histidine kinase dimerization/phospho-acceptor domain-containing protein, partial [Clostridia bacterium]|nr:histidine kinase dimerization/phospho-acceptor domain-containing protein [Clostridia bacterium]